MAEAKKSTAKPTKKTAAKSAAKKSGTAAKKLTISLDAETMAVFQEYIDEFGYSKDEFVKKAIMEKISRDKISSMIDTMVRL